MAGPSSGVRLSVPNVGAQELTEQAELKSKVVAAVRALAKAIGFLNAFTVLDTKQNAAASIQTFLNKPRVSEKLSRLFEKLDTTLTPEQESICSNLILLDQLGGAEALGDGFEFLPNSVKSLMNVCDIKEENEQSEIQFVQDFSVLCAQLAKFLCDAKKHNFPDCFKAYVLCHGLCLFFQKATVKLPASYFKLNPGFYVPAAIAFNICNFLGSTKVKFSEQVSKYMDGCFSEDFKQNNYSRPKSSGNTIDKNSSHLSSFVNQDASLLPYVLQLLPMLFDGFAFCASCLTGHFKAKTIPNDFSTVILECRAFSSGNFSDALLIARVGMGSDEYTSRLRGFCGVRMLAFSELMKHKNVGEISIEKGLQSGLIDDSFYKGMSDPVFYPIYFAYLLGKVTSTQGLTNLDNTIIDLASKKIEGKYSMLWMNAMISCGLVSLRLNAVKLSDGAWSSEGQSTCSLYFSFQSESQFNNVIQGITKNREDFLSKYKNCKVEVVLNSCSIFDISRKRFGSLGPKNLSLNFVCPDGNKQIPLSINVVNLIMAVFDGMSNGEALAALAVKSVAGSRLSPLVNQLSAKEVDGRFYIKPAQIPVDGSTAHVVDVTFYSQDFINSLNNNKDSTLVIPKLSVQLVLNDNAVVLACLPPEKIGEFLKENAVDFFICDHSDPNDYVFYSVPMDMVPNSFFDQLQKFSKKFPFLKCHSESDDFLLKMLFAPTPLSEGENPRVMTDEKFKGPSLVSTLSDVHLKQVWKILSPVGQRILFALCPEEATQSRLPKIGPPQGDPTASALSNVKPGNVARGLSNTL